MKGKRLNFQEVWQYFLFSGVLLFLISGMYSCTNEIVVGSDLLDDEIILIDVTEDVQLNNAMVYNGPFVTFDSLVADRRTVFIGKITDPTFGTKEAALALGFNMSSSNPSAYPIGTKTLKADSLILSLAYDTLATYGSLTMPFHITVKQLVNTLPAGRTIQSDLAIQTGDTWVDTMVYIRPKDTVKIFNPVTKETLPVGFQIRFKLPQDVADRLINDVPASSTDSAFVALMKGVYIEAKPMGEEAMAGFNLSTTALASSLSNKLIMYYTEADTAKKIYNYGIRTRFVNTAKNEFAGSIADQYVQDSTLTAQVSFIQGFGGPRLKVNLSNLDIFQDKAINYAQLEFWAEPSTGILGQFAAPGQLYAFTKNSDGTYSVIKDILPISLSSAVAVFGGKKTTQDGKILYKMNITNQLRSFVKDASLDRNIYISTPSQAEYMDRAIIYGPAHDMYPMKIKVNFTTK